MAKQTQVKAFKDRPMKKARVESPAAQKVVSKRKGSPHPAARAAPALPSQDKTSPTAPKGEGKEKDDSTTRTASKPKNKGKAREDPTPLPTSFKIVAGSYEKLLYGLDGSVTFDDSTQELRYTLKPVFIFPAHVSCIKAVAASPHGGKWLATSSADEIVKVWDLRRRKEIGGLMDGRSQAYKNSVLLTLIYTLSSYHGLNALLLERETVLGDCLRARNLKDVEELVRLISERRK